MSGGGRPQISAVPREREREFTEWVRRNQISDLDHPESFYDYRGAFLSGVNRGPDGHWPDTFKQAGHPTFSNESQYAVGDDARRAGRWDGERFIAPDTTRQPMSGGGRPQIPARRRPGFGLGDMGHVTPIPNTDLPEGVELQGWDTPAPDDQEVADFQRWLTNKEQQAPPRPEDQPEDRTTGRALRDFGRAAFQGATFGFGDEIIGRARSLSPNQTYSDAVTDERESLDYYRQDHPVLAPVAEIAGAVGTGVGTGLAKLGVQGARGARALVTGAQGAQRAGAFANVGRAAAAGAGSSALYGAGTAEGGPVDRAAAGVAAAPLGAALGVAIPAVGKGVMAGGRALGVNQAITSATKYARDRVIQALRETGLTPAQLKQQILSNRPKPEMLADLGGESAQRLARGAQTISTPQGTRLGQFSESRMAGQGRRTVEDIRHVTGLADEDMVSTVEDLVQRRGAAAKPLYDQARAHGVLQNPNLRGPGLQQLLKRPSMKRAYEQARQLAADEGVDLPAANAITHLDLQTADYIKRGLDEVLYLGKRGGAESGGLGPESRRLVLKLQRHFMEEVDAEVPAYKQARQTFAGPTRSMEAIEEGQSLWRRTADLDEALSEFRAMSPGEQQFYRRGAIDGLRSRLDEIGDDRNKLKGLFDSPADRRRLIAVLGSEKNVDTFKRELQREAAMSTTRNTVRTGSNTVPRLGDTQDASGMRGLVRALLNPRETMLRAVDDVVPSGRKAAQQMDEMSRILGAGREGRDQLLRVLDELIAAEQQSARVKAGVRGGRAGVSGAVGGQRR